MLRADPQPALWPATQNCFSSTRQTFSEHQPILVWSMLKRCLGWFPRCWLAWPAASRDVTRGANPGDRPSQNINMSALWRHTSDFVGLRKHLFNLENSASLALSPPTVAPFLLAGVRPPQQPHLALRQSGQAHLDDWCHLLLGRSFKLVNSRRHFNFARSSNRKLEAEGR